MRAVPIKSLSVHLVLIIGAIVLMIPFFWMIITSLKTSSEALLIPPTLLPENWQFSNYINVWKESNFVQYYLNTFIVMAVRTGGQFFLCSMAAFAISTMRFPGKNIIFVMMLSVMMFPPQIVMIPVYALMNQINWLDTYYVLTVPMMAGAFGVFLLRQFFLSIPRDLYEAARIDGCSFPRIYWSIYMPLSIPALVSLSIFVILGSWNDFLWPLVMTSSPDMMVLSVAIASFAGEFMTDYPSMMAAALMSVIPLILIYLFFQRYFIEGIALTGVKG
ncbi:carbohydrate ABC transporter permease [Salibacterium aidingense]|uniref:carbohydrate ABC transporter permease n=1 Tax=Salibacterium aidingense TaxID=384933 RepID=UPI00055414B3|nr:carbohydrate ABC transporter permease [Salibacterium aidingense]